MQGNPFALKNGRRGLLLVHVPDPSWVDFQLHQHDDHPPPFSVARLEEIVSSIPPSQFRIGVYKWHRVLGELQSMALALPGARGCLSKCRKPFAMFRWP